MSSERHIGIPDPVTMIPGSVVRFGEAEWQPHLGGALFGPERDGNVSWNWLGAGKCWIVLPEPADETDYLVRLEAAPLAPYESSLRRVMVRDTGGAELLEVVVPEGGGAFSMHAALRLTEKTHRGGTIQAEIVVEPLPPPSIRVLCADVQVAELVFNCRPELQFRDFLLRREVMARPLVLHLEPRPALVPPGLPAAAESRRLSFRLFRMLVYPLP